MNGELSISAAIESAKTVLLVREGLEQSAAKLREHADRLAEIAADVQQRIDSTPETYPPLEWKVIGTGVSVLACKAKCQMIAHGGDGTLTEEEARLRILFDEFKGNLRSLNTYDAVSTESIRQRILSQSEVDAGDIAKMLLAIPMPPLYWEAQKDRDVGSFGSERTEKEPPPIVRVIAEIDSEPVATPQLISPQRLYTITFRVRGIGWPELAKALHLSLLTTCPREEYSLSSFELPRPSIDGNNEYQEELSGQINFRSAQSTLLEDIVFRLRGAFELPDGEFQDVPIIGYHELRLRVVNQDRYPLMGSNQRIDRHILELISKLLEDCPTAKDELDDLVPLLSALNRLLTTYTQHAIYKGATSIPESEFHDTVLRDLSLQLGSDVQNHPRQAGGITDIRYRGAIVELKVEKDDGDRKRLGEKYAKQATQYEGVEARQVSILLVLDLTQKDKPPGDLRNDVLLVDVPTHGGNDEDKKYPSKAFVIVMNGNIKSPSDYS